MHPALMLAIFAFLAVFLGQLKIDVSVPGHHAAANHAIPEEVPLGPSWKQCGTPLECDRQMVRIARVMGCSTAEESFRAGGVVRKWIPVRDWELKCEELFEESEESRRPFRAAESRAQEETRAQAARHRDAYRRGCETGANKRGCGR